MQKEATRAAPPATLHPAGRYGDIGLSGLEVASGLALGRPEQVTLPPAADDPVAQLEQVLADALRRPPCLVAFSGGRDSSGLLGLAARVAAREGLEAPVAITQRFPGVPETAEDSWQELVVGHLGIADWVRIEQPEGLDVVGPVARRALTRHGAIYPVNAHFALPLLDNAGDGTVVTGLDGDLLFGGWRWQAAADRLAGRARRKPRDVITTAHRFAPRALQRVVLRRAATEPQPRWLTPAGRRLCLDLRVRNLRVQVPRFDHFVEWVASSRHIRLMTRQLDLFGQGTSARIVHPFLDPRFLSAYARWGGRDGRGDRTAAMRALFGELVPERTTARSSKARFDGVYMGAETRAFASEWDGSGLDPELVDAEALRAELSSPKPSITAGSLAQWLWVARSREAGA